MPDYDDQVDQIYRAIQELPVDYRIKLWDILEGAFPGYLDDTDPDPEELWDDYRNGFGSLGALMLRFLAERGDTDEMVVIKLLWPKEFSYKIKTENILRQRLRKLEQRTRQNLIKLKSDWVLSRPGRRVLALSR